LTFNRPGKFGVLLGLNVLVLGCSIPRIDFDAKLNSTIGSPISTTWYDKFDDPKLKQLLNETADVLTYEHRLSGPITCAWTVDVDKKTSLVLRWKYVSKEAGDSCHDLRAGPKP